MNAATLTSLVCGVTALTFLFSIFLKAKSLGPFREWSRRIFPFFPTSWVVAVLFFIEVAVVAGIGLAAFTPWGLLAAVAVNAFCLLVTIIFRSISGKACPCFGELSMAGRIDTIYVFAALTALSLLGMAASN